MADLPAEIEVHIFEGIRQAERGEFADLTSAETRGYVETGELPERVERWLESCDSRVLR